MAAVIMFVPDSRDGFHDAIGALHGVVETLSEWGDRITGAADRAQDAAKSAAEAADKAKAAVERITD